MEEQKIQEPDTQSASPVAVEERPVEKPAEIHVIPEKFYGAALKTKIKTSVPQLQVSGAVPKAPKRKSGLIIVVILVLLLIGAGGIFVYLNRDSLFGAPPAVPVIVVQQPTTTQPVVPPPLPAPSAPANLAATSTSPQSVSLNWTDTSDNEAAYRVERRTSDGTIYARVTDLPPNSTSFLDGSVQASSTYFYRVIARNNTGESDPSNEAVATTRSLPPAPPKQEPLPPAGLDSDSDGISDLEEAIFGSDVRNPDSDGDGFLDGNEVFNLYNPMGKAPAKLADSGMVKEVGGAVGWTMLIPTKWSMALDDADGSAATISSDHGEKFVVSIEDNPDNMSIVDWYLAKYQGTDKTTLMKYKSKGGYEGIIGPDLLTTYIPWGNKIFVFQYDRGTQPFINLRTVYSLMLNSVTLKGLSLEMVSAGTGQLPFEPAATEPGVITQPVSVDQTSTDSGGQSTSTNSAINP